MAIQAAIFVNAPAKGDEGTPRAFLKAGGISLLERQLRQLTKMGVKRVALISKTFTEKLEAARFKQAPAKVEIHNQNALKGGRLWNARDDVLLLEEGVLVDARIMKAVTTKPGGRRVAVFPGNTVIYNKGHGLKLKAKGGDYLFASAALVKGADLLAAIKDRDFRARPLKAVLKAALNSGRAALADIGKIDTYLQDRRRNVDILWRPVVSGAETGKATRALIGMAQKGVLDWPARWIHPFFENALVAMLCPTPVTPNFITLITTVVGFYVTWLFATGDMLWGLAGALVIGVLDGVDGKLARTKMLQSRIGELEHIADKVVEYSWYFGIAWYLAGAEGNALPWALAVMIVLFAWAEVVQGEFFRRFTGKQLDDAGKFERAFRIIGARRNTQIWALIPFALLDQWLMGFWVVAIYAALTFFVAQARFIIRLRDYGSEKSLEIKKNIGDTAYF